MQGKNRGGVSKIQSRCTEERGGRIGQKEGCYRTAGLVKLQKGWLGGTESDGRLDTMHPEAPSANLQSTSPRQTGFSLRAPLAQVVALLTAGCKVIAKEA